jgi:hypothetical protein
MEKGSTATIEHRTSVLDSYHHSIIYQYSTHLNRTIKATTNTTSPNLHPDQLPSSSRRAI